MAQLTKTAAESLAFTEVQAFFDRLYPPVGGIAFDNLGVVTVNILNDRGDRVFLPTDKSRPVDSPCNTASAVGKNTLSPMSLRTLTVTTPRLSNAIPPTGGYRRSKNALSLIHI